MAVEDIVTYTDGWRASWTKAGLENQWGADEVAALIEHYPGHGPLWPGWADILPKRSKSAIENMAHRVGVTSKHRWTEAEEAAVAAHYGEHGGAWDGWARLLPGMTTAQIASKARDLGVRFDGWRGSGRAWTADEDDFLAANSGHGKGWPGWDEGLPGRSWSAVLQRARKLGIHVGRGGHGRRMWEEREDAALKAVLSKLALATGRTELAVAQRMLAIAERTQTGEENA